jgi:hypothetical protein
MIHCYGEAPEPARAKGPDLIGISHQGDCAHFGDKAVLRWIDQAAHPDAAIIVFTTGPTG